MSVLFNQQLILILINIEKFLNKTLGKTEKERQHKNIIKCNINVFLEFVVLMFTRALSTAFFAAFFLTIAIQSNIAHAYPTKEPVITKAGSRCVVIATAGVDHGEKVAQEYADSLLMSDIDQFKKTKKIKKVKISNRFRKCKFHLWFFGNEYNCTSKAKVCW